MNTHCDIEDLGDRLVVTNRNAGRRNALTPELYAGLRAALAQAAASPRIAAVILTGEGDFFCAGGDLNLLLTAQGMSEDIRRHHIHDLAQLIRDVMDCPRPVIAAVEGGAAGAGLSLALACDLIVAAQDANFTAAYVKAGLVPDGGLTGSLMGALPPALAIEAALLGRPIPATRMAELGAINRLSAPGEALAEAHRLADALAQGPAVAQASIKGLMSHARRAMMEGQLQAEVPAMADALVSAEAAEGIAAFLGKRKPDFAGMRQRED